MTAFDWLRAKCQCAKVARHDSLVAVGLAVLSAAAAWHIGDTGVDDVAASGFARAVAVVFAVYGFAQALLCLLAVPWNRVNDARLGVGAYFAALAWLDGVASASLSSSERVFHVIGYLTVAVVSAAALVEKDVMDELRKESGR